MPNQHNALKVQKDLSTLVELEPERECSEFIGTIQSEQSTSLGRMKSEIDLLSTSTDRNVDSSTNANSVYRSNDGG